MHTKRFNKLFKKWVQFRMGQIPRLPLMNLWIGLDWIGLDWGKSI